MLPPHVERSRVVLHADERLFFAADDRPWGAGTLPMGYPFRRRGSVGGQYTPSEGERNRSNRGGAPRRSRFYRVTSVRGGALVIESFSLFFYLQQNVGHYKRGQLKHIIYEPVIL